jgi:hypothetical protein
MVVQINGRGFHVNSNNRFNVVATFGPEILLVDDINNAVIPLGENGEPVVELLENGSYSLIKRSGV